MHFWFESLNCEHRRCLPFPLTWTHEVKSVTSWQLLNSTRRKGTFFWEPRRMRYENWHLGMSQVLRDSGMIYFAHGSHRAIFVFETWKRFLLFLSYYSSRFFPTKMNSGHNPSVSFTYEQALPVRDPVRENLNSKGFEKKNMDTSQIFAQGT